MFVMNSIGDTVIPKVAPLTMTLTVNDNKTKFEVDTGSGVTVMNDSDFQKLWSGKIRPEHIFKGMMKKCSEGSLRMKVA